MPGTAAQLPNSIEDRLRIYKWVPRKANTLSPFLPMSSDTASEKSGGLKIKVATVVERDADVAAQLTAGTDIDLDDQEAKRLKSARVFS